MRKRSHLILDEDQLEDPLINLTPLIDVVFVVLIAVMLVSPMLDVDSIFFAPSVPNGQKNTQAIQDSLLSITIRSDDSIWIGGRQVTLSDLEKYLLKEKVKHPLEIPILMPDARAHFEAYQSVKNVLECCGFQQMDLVLRPG